MSTTLIENTKYKSLTDISAIGIVLLQADGVTRHSRVLLAPIIVRKHLQLAADQHLFVLDREYNLSSLLG